MKNIKEKVRTLIDQMPDDSSIEDIMEQLYIKQKIIKAQEQMQSGHFYTHTEAKELAAKWIK